MDVSGKGDKGVIIASMDTGEFKDEASKLDWEYLATGIMVRTDAGALVRFGEPLSPGRDRNTLPRQGYFPKRLERLRL